MTDTTKHGGKRLNAGRRSLSNEKRDYRYFLTKTEKGMIDGYRKAKGLEK